MGDDLGAVSMDVDLRGRVSNLSVPKGRPLMPLFEAVVNSLHAVEDRGSTGVVEIHLLRDRRQTELKGERAERPITGFVVKDNGVGFTEENYQSFRRSDSQQKLRRGGKGVGRLLWLKGFDSVRVESVYRTSTGETRRREFKFQLSDKPIQEHSDALAPGLEPSTSIHLLSMHSALQSTCPKRLQTIAARLIEHCLPHLLLEKSAKIHLYDDDNTAIDIHRLWQESYADRTINESFELQSHGFQMVMVQDRSPETESHSVRYYANGREVLSRPLKQAIPMLTGPLPSEAGKFYWTTYVTGDYLDHHTDQVRSAFTFPDVAEEQGSIELTLPAIQEEVVTRLRPHLEPSLSPVREETRRRVDALIEQSRPEFRFVEKYEPGIMERIPAHATDEDIDAVMNRARFEIERKARAEVNAILGAAPEQTGHELERRTAAIFGTISELNKADLAGYVARRRAVLDLLEHRLKKQSDGDYLKEEVVHELFAVMGVTSHDVPDESLNLWLIDERLSFHRLMASNLPIDNEKLGAPGKKPDLLIERRAFVSGEGDRASHVLIVEFKRPGRGDYGPGKSPIVQVQEYVIALKEQTATVGGRAVQVSDQTLFEAYVICDVTPALRKQLEIFDDCKRDADGRSWRAVKQNMNLFVEVIPFDVVLRRAKERNDVFFRKVGIRGPKP
ncbi:MAG: ATP-binding protein [Deltaproteobacteria bacterium]|nr:ATP-binding protein [Deltaproteobacteria bacterium]